ncbi:flagellar motor switch protein FliM [Vibrio sp. SM6]|uniref:Flagellar motor switch protein FliM n=1 Tax=Vibrio agarilyticus TaxID=2726741 RepID=A0A7X8YHL2_9VIBR|nr:FliM/FliN family flagellar motor switch protein [Vibrio agarilyticus]NLS13705.1 flagellar motor switch protein FliM [Vibrio agarilyticus]
MGTTVYSSKPELQAIDVELLGKPIHAVRDNLTAIIDAASLSLTNTLQDWLKTHHVNVTLQSVTLQTFNANTNRNPNACAQRHLEGGLAYVQLDDALLVALADRFYRAALTRTEAVLTSSDLRLQERISKVVASWIAPSNMWAPCAFEYPHGMGLRATLDIEMGEVHGQLILDLESQLIDTLIAQLGLQHDRLLTDEFNQALNHTPVRLNVLLSRKTLPLSEVLSLAPNDILPIELLNTVPVSIGNELLFHGRVADQEGQLVVILNHD